MGWLKVNESTPFAGYSGTTHRTLKGYGLGLTLSRQNVYDLSVTIAQRDSDGERATSEQDERTRLWANFGVYF